MTLQRFQKRVYSLGILVAATSLYGGESSSFPKVGEAVDLAAFGARLSEPNGVGVEWENPREVHELELVPGSPGARLPADVHVEWWGSVWPANGTGGWMKLDDHWNGHWVGVACEATRDEKSGALRIQFPALSQKEWKKALKDEEYPGKKPPEFRRTLKVRVLAGAGGSLKDAQLRSYGASQWCEGAFDIETMVTGETENAGHLQVINGHLESLAALPSSVAVASFSGNTWQFSGVAGQSQRVRARLLYSHNEDANSNDLSRVTVRLGKAAEATGFSFVPENVLSEGAVRVPALGVLVTPADSSITMANDPGLPPAPPWQGGEKTGAPAWQEKIGAPAWQEKVGAPPSQGGDGGVWRRTVRQRVAEMPEMSREQAMANIPRLQPPRWVPLGVPCARQEICVGPGGDWMIDPGSLWTEARDSQRCTLRGKEKLYAILDTNPNPTFKETKEGSFKRYLEAGYLPLIHVEWDQDGVHFHHELAATILLGDIGEDEKRRGDETVCLLTKLEISNPGNVSAQARVALRFSNPTPISLTSEGLIELQPGDRSKIPEGLTAIRGMISVGRPAAGGAAGWQLQPGKDPKASSVLSWSAPLPPGDKQVMYFKAAYVDLLEAAELDALKAISFEERVPHDLTYWKDRLDRDAQLDVPEPELVNFYKSNLWHNVITCDRDPKTGLYNEGVGTFNYKVFANETVMIARSMDMRGEHLEAERYLEPLLHFQGAEALTGRFTTKQGVFHSAGAYTHGQYAMNHGFTMWGIADHYLQTRDRKYMERVAPQLIKGCDFVIAQRKATTTAPSYDAWPSGPPPAPPWQGGEKQVAPPSQGGEKRDVLFHQEGEKHDAPAYQGGERGGLAGKSDTYGLCPASSLEDVIEFKYWFPTNAYFYLGMKRVAQALAGIQHPDAERLAREAESYRQDIERAVREAATKSALVRLRNGTYVPFVPSRVHQWRALTEGWIREALYGGVDLTVGEVMRPDDPLITWVLDQLEDNTFYSAASGYNVKDVEKNWFGQGGVTLQPCLVDLPRLYMNRDENAASLRAFWNAYALLIYPDTQCFAEWAHGFGRGGGPVYKTSDEARFCMWFRQFLVNEEGDTLWLARGTPRAWLEEGKTIQVQHASTWFGDVSYMIRSQAAANQISATITLPNRNKPHEAWLRLRHPKGLNPTQVLIDGHPAASDQVTGQDIRLLPGPTDPTKPVEVVATYGR